MRPTPRHGGPLRPDGTVALRTPVTQNDLAGWSGQSREAVVKAFRALRLLGWIDVDGKHILLLLLLLLLDVAALRARSQSA